MRNRTRAVAAAAVTAAFAAGSIGAAVASTTGSKPSAHAKTVTVNAKRAGYDDLAARLGVSPARLDHALSEVKISLVRANANLSPGQFDAALARILGIPQARVRHAFPPEPARGSRVAVSKAPVSKAAARAEFEAFTSAVARELHVSTARVKAALRAMFEAGRADPSSPQFAAAARSIGVSAGQLIAALRHAKESLAGGK